MLILKDLLPADQPPKIARLLPYIDTVELSSRRPFPSELLRCIKANCGSMLPDVVKDRDDPKVIWHYLLAINQPSRHCIELLQRYTTCTKLSIYRLHIAYDVFEICEGITREDVIEVFENLCHLRYRRVTDGLHDDRGTRYSIRVANRKTRPYRNTAFYSGRDSKITGECDAIHFEIRLERKRSVLKVVNEPADLLQIKPDDLFAKQIAIKDHRDILETIIRRSIRAIKPSTMFDVEMRIRAHCMRLGMQHTSEFGRYFRKQFERLKHRDCVSVDALNWACPDVLCEDKVGELHCLLPPPSIRPAKRRERLRIRERL